LTFFVTCLLSTVKGCKPDAKPPSWRTASCRWSTAAYLIYSQVTSNWRPSLLFTSRGRAMLWWKGDPPNMADKYWLRTKLIYSFNKFVLVHSDKQLVALCSLDWPIFHPEDLGDTFLWFFGSHTTTWRYFQKIAKFIALFW
jgi:hypothetical protein